MPDMTPHTRSLTVLEGLDDAAENGLDGPPYGVEEITAAAGEIREMRKQVEAIAAGSTTAEAVISSWLARDETMSRMPY